LRFNLLSLNLIILMATMWTLCVLCVCGLELPYVFIEREST